MYEFYFKRVFDIVFSFLFLVILMPVFIVLYLFLVIIDGRPAFFLQQRIGVGENKFKVIKFRTMVVDAERIGSASTILNDSRITPLGKFLRKYSLDELPQLINILKGDMSFVGYRPGTSVNETRRLVGVYHKKPGLTGLAQISGRSFLTVDEKIEYEKKYNSNITLCNDFKILILTFLKVIRSKNSY